jgi:hypothetical protein
MTAKTATDNSVVTAAIYVIGLIFLLNPPIDVLTQAWPWRVGATEWRYGTVGIAANYLVSSVFGMLLMTLAAAWRQQRAALRVLAALNLLATGVLMVASVGFVLDVLQLRGNVPPEARRTFYIGAAKALLKYGMTVVGLALVGIAAWKGARSIQASARDADEPALVRTVK